MKRSLFVISLITVLAVGLALAQGTPPQRGGAAGRGGGMAAPPAATGPIADLANAQIDAINKGDAAFFDSHLADTVVWFDEDGHAIAGKDRVSNFIKMRLLTGGKKVTITGLRVGNSNDGAWAGYQYTIDGGPTQRKGTQTVVYQKVGADWKIVMVHGAVNAAGHM
jgi:ketosteroid isomerase-like protein